MSEAMEWIYSIRGAAWRRRLDRMARLAEVMGVPNGGQRNHVHIGGTNGKGSTVTMAEAMLRAAGLTTGSCVSPYVYTVRERMAANGENIAEQCFIRMANLAKEAAAQLAAEQYGTCTVFEIFTAMAFSYWEAMGVEYSVVEVGLGGTLDCTNIIDPVVSAIVSIGFDHMDVLGGSLFEIAEEKAGIIKPGRPAIMGEITAEAMAPMEERATEVGATIHRYGKEWIVTADKDRSGFKLESAFGTFDLPKPRHLRAPIQVHNAGIAAQCFLAATAGRLSIEEQRAAMETGLQTAFIPGRFEVLRRGGRTWILDGAHNEQSAAELVRTFRGQFPGIRPNILFGMIQRHDPLPVAQALKLLGGEIRCVPISWDAAVAPRDLAATCAITNWHQSLEDAFAHLDSEFVLVTGSFYLLSDCRKMIDGLEAIGHVAEHSPR
ncbi:MAG: hypothetical protein JSS71_12685 [Armatimonadetes bacterium]|nr:hypothetical protein [Armatimonadota bacterium]MBX3110186.1 hypothetical protein [Fimbriimonadaceae bacterium]